MYLIIIIKTDQDPVRVETTRSLSDQDEHV